MLDDLEFIAPEPQDCKEIEEYVISLKNGEPNVGLKTVNQIYSTRKPKKIVSYNFIAKTFYKCKIFARLLE